MNVNLRHELHDPGHVLGAVGGWEARRVEQGCQVAEAQMVGRSVPEFQWEGPGWCGRSLGGCSSG